MTFSPKITIVSGVALAAVGAYEIRKAVKESDKKKKIIHGLIGVGLMMGGIFAGRKGVLQVIGLEAQKKKVSDDNPAKNILSEIEVQNSEGSKKNTEKVKSRAPLNFKGDNNSDSFDQIMNSSGDGQIIEKQIVLHPEVKKPVLDNNRGGIKVVGSVDPKKLEESRRVRQEIKMGIDAKDAELKKTVKNKVLGGWHSDKAKQLRYDIAILKAKLFHI